MKISNEKQKIPKVVWAVTGLIVGSLFGAIFGIIAYNNQWLG